MLVIFHDVPAQIIFDDRDELHRIDCEEMTIDRP